MLRILDDLYRGIVSLVDRHVSRQWDLRQANGMARVWVVGGPCYLPHFLHGQRIILGNVPKAQVDVKEGAAVACEPAGLEGHGAAAHGPVGSV